MLVIAKSKIKDFKLKCQTNYQKKTILNMLGRKRTFMQKKKLRPN